MNQRRCLYSIVFVLICLKLIFVPLQVVAEEQGYFFLYNVHKGEAYIIGFYGHGSVLEIPEYIEQYPVRGIGDPYIDFNNSDALTYCWDYMNGDETFTETEVKKVILPGTLRYVCERFLGDNRGVEELIINDGANFEVGVYTFHDYKENTIKKIYLGSGMIGNIAPMFYGKALQTIEVSPNNPQYYSVDGVLYTKDMKILVICGTANQADTIVVPEGVQMISLGFELCSQIKNIVLPASITTVDASCFKGCNALLIVKKGSYLHKFCWENGLNYFLADGEIEDDGKIEAPIGFEVANADEKSVTLKWETVSNAEGYYVYVTNPIWNESILNNLKNAVKLSKNQTMYTFGELEEDVEYLFQIVAYRTANWEEVQSKVVSIKAKTALNSIDIEKKLTTPVIKYVNRKSAKKAKITWKKIANVDGLEIYVSKKKKCGFKKYATIKKIKATSATISKLKKGEKYYVKIRTYRMNKGKKIYSNYSKVKNIKK